ncbi:MAG: leucine-rich repeat domain-containing protein [Promethearchaeota archaeon]
MLKLILEDIYRRFKEGTTNRYTTFDALKHIIENSNDQELRYLAIKYLSSVCNYNKNTFSFFENLLISDNNEKIRAIAGEIIIKYFPNKAIEPLLWTFKNEKSEYCIISIIKKLVKANKTILNKLLREIDFIYHKKGSFFIIVKNNRLYLNRLNIKDISSIIGLEHLKNLKELYIQDNNITEIKGLNKLDNLETLSLQANKIKRIKNINELITLKHLNLQANQIREINGLENLSNLISLNLTANKISEISGLDSLKNLKMLSLSNNNISEIKGLNKLLNLRELYLNYNDITDLKGLENLKKLKRLEIYSNKIAEIKGLDSLINLKFLNLRDNQIKRIYGLSNLKNLSFLNLNSNEIKKIEGLDNLANLKYLYLENNYISMLYGLESLKNLKILNLRNTDISTFLDYIFFIPKLKEINLINCPISNIHLIKRKQKLVQKNSLNIKLYDEIYTGYREPISKEIINIAPIDIPFNSNIFKKLKSYEDPIDFFLSSYWKISRYSKEFEIYKVDKLGLITRVK